MTSVRSSQMLPDHRDVRTRHPALVHPAAVSGVPFADLFHRLLDPLGGNFEQLPDTDLSVIAQELGCRAPLASTARAQVTVELAPGLDQQVLLPAGTEFATASGESAQPVVFSTLREYSLASARLLLAGTVGAAAGGLPADGAFTPLAKGVELGQGGQAALVLSRPVPGMTLVVVLRAEGGAELKWEAWRGDTGTWVECPATPLPVEGATTRCVAVRVPAVQGQFTLPALSGICLSRPGTGLIRCTGSTGSLQLVSPEVGLAARGVVEAVEGRLIRQEELGVSTGRAGQVFTLRNSISVSSLTPEIEAVNGAVTTVWTMVDSFAASDSSDRHFMVDAARGRMMLSPDLRHGQAPPAGAVLRVPLYHHSGGGGQGNVPARAISILRTPRPEIASVVNESPAVGGADSQSQLFGTPSPVAPAFPTRSVMSVAECEKFVLTAGLGVARARCLSAPVRVGDTPMVRFRVLMLARSDPLGRLTPSQLQPTAEALDAIRWRLLSHLPAGVQAEIKGIDLIPVSTKVTVRALAGTPQHKLEEIAGASCTALHRYFSPLPGSGPNLRGWPEGQLPTQGDCHLALEDVPGVGSVADAVLTCDAQQLGPNELPVSRAHHVTCASVDGAGSAEFEA
ncbi:hypothetical protein [Streptomyces sp. CAS3]